MTGAVTRAVAAAVAVALTPPGPAAAHGVGWQREADGAAVALSFAYTGGEPLAFAAVTVQRPENDAPVHQAGRADRAGRFAFVPDRPGAWQVEADDGMGHRLRAVVQVVPPGRSVSGLSDPGMPGSGPADAPPAPAAVLVALGFSLIANLFGGWFLWLRRRTAGRQPAGPGSNPGSSFGAGPASDHATKSLPRP